MEININLDLPGIIAQAVSTERLQPLVDKAIADALKCAIEDATGYRSDFRASLKTQLAEALPHGLNLRDVVKFQQVLNDSLSGLIHDTNSTAISTALDRVAREVIPDVPSTVKMTALLKSARGGFHKEDHESFYAFYEPSRYSTGGGWLYLDGDESPGSSTLRGSSRESRKYQSAYRLAFNEDGVVYALRLDGKDITPASRPDVLGEFMTLLMAMYVGRTRIEIDMDADDVEYAANEQED